MSPSTLRLLNRDGKFNVSKGRKKRAFLTDAYHALLSASWTTFFALLAGAYFATNTIFAVGYVACGSGALSEGGLKPGLPAFWEAFFFSVQTMATIGYGRITPVGMLPNILVTLEALVGLLGFALATGLLFARFSRPIARVIFSKIALITPHDGVPSFMLRVANARRNQIVEAQANLVLIRYETTAEGERYRTFTNLELESHETPVFALTWTIVHPITPKSPLYDLTAEDLLRIQAEVLVSLTGIDETYSQTIRARYSYVPTEMVWNRAFEDVLYQNPDGSLGVKLDGMHKLKELPAQIHPSA